MNEQPLEQVVIELVAKFDKFVKDSNAAVDKVTKDAAGKFDGLGKKIAGAVGGAAVGFAVGSLGTKFKELDDTMAGVSARAGLTEKQTDKLTKSVIALSKANLQGQKEIAGTAEALISLQGVSADNTEEIERLTSRYLDFALVTGQTAPDAVAAFDDVLDAWGLTAEDANGIMDQLILSHQRFGTDIPAAQAALNKYASTFQTLGLDINDAVGYINLFADSGIDAESSAAAFNKAVGLLTENSEASNKKLAEMVTNLGLTTEEIEAFAAADPAGKFDILTKAIAATEDPTLRAQAAIDLFGSKAGPKLAEALAGNNLDDFQISVEEAAGASEEAANKIESSLTNRLKLLGNEITGRAMELTQQFAPALQAIGLLGPQVSGAIGGIAGALSGIEWSKLGGTISAPVVTATQGAINIAQTVTQTIVQVGKNVLDAGLDVIQKITQRITKVEVTPAGEKAAEAAGKKVGVKLGEVTSLAFLASFTGAIGTVIGNLIAIAIVKATWAGFLAGAATAGWVALAAIIAAGIGAALFIAFKKLDYSDSASAILTGIVSAMLILMPAALPILIGGVFLDKFAKAIFDAVTGAVADFFTPENIGRRLADIIALAIFAPFAPIILAVKFREQIAGLGKALMGVLVDVLTAEIQTPIGGIKVWEAITGLLLPAPAVVYEFFKQGIADILVRFFGDLPGIASEKAGDTGRAIGDFFGTTLPDLLTRESFVRLTQAVVEFFGTTLPNAIVVEVPKIPGAILGVLASLPDQVSLSLDFVTQTVTGWVTGLADWLGFNFIPWNWISEGVNGFIDELGMWLDFVFGAGTGSMIGGAISGVATWLAENFKPWDWVSAGFAVFRDTVALELAGIVTLFVTLPTNIINGMVGVATALTQIGIDLVAGIATGAADALYGPVPGIASLLSIMQAIPAEVLLIFFQMPVKPIEWLVQVGKDIVRGLYNGIINLAPSLLQQAVDLIFSLIPGPLRRLLGSDSPSEVMMAIGADILAGLLLPLQNSDVEVRGAVKTLFDVFMREINTGQIQVDDALSHLMDGLSAIVNDPMHLNDFRTAALDLVKVWVAGLQEGVANAPPVSLPPPYGPVWSGPGQDPNTVGGGPGAPVPNPSYPLEVPQPPLSEGGVDESIGSTILGKNSTWANYLRLALGVSLTTLKAMSVSDAINRLNARYSTSGDLARAADAAANTSIWSTFMAALRTRGLTFDMGGLLPPGLSLAWNRTGEPEAIMGSRQFEQAMTRAIEQYEMSGAANGRGTVTNYGRQIFVFGPGRQSRDVIRDLDRILA